MSTPPARYLASGDFHRTHNRGFSALAVGLWQLSPSWRFYRFAARATVVGGVVGTITQIVRDSDGLVYVHISGAISDPPSCTAAVS